MKNLGKFLVPVALYPFDLLIFQVLQEVQDPQRGCEESRDLEISSHTGKIPSHVHITTARDVHLLLPLDHPLEEVPVCEWEMGQVPESGDLPSPGPGSTPLHSAEWEWDQ